MSPLLSSLSFFFAVLFWFIFTACVSLGSLAGSSSRLVRNAGVASRPEGSASSSGCDGLGNCYISAAANGKGNGTSWINAYRGFGTGTGEINPAAMSRGVTYWIAGGAYGAQRFSTPDSSTTPIMLEGATTASHGPADDWNNSYASTQATFIGETRFTTDYWTVNGQAVPGCSYPEGSGDSGDACYTLHFWNKTAAAGTAIDVSGTNTIRLVHVEIEGTGQGFPHNASTSDRCSTNNCGIWADNAIYQSTPFSNLYVAYSYIHHTGNTQFQMNASGPGGAVNQTATWEYNWVSYNHTGQNGQHDEAYSLLADNVIIRYNVFQDISGSGMITTAAAGAPTLSNWDIYGNLFFWDPAYLSLDGQYWEATCDNAIVSLLDGMFTGYVHFYNNTIANYNPANIDSKFGAFSTMAISGTSGYAGGAVTVVVENNLWYNSAYVYGDYSPYCTVNPNATCIYDYNASFRGQVLSVDKWQTQQSPARHDYNVSRRITPFAGAQPASTHDGFRLATPDPFRKHPAMALGSPYNQDMLGVTRGANGIWDRGALQSGKGAAHSDHQGIRPDPSRSSSAHSYVRISR